MEAGALGKTYKNGEVIVRQGDTGDSMYVIQDGLAEVVAEKDGREVRLRTLGKGEFVGEMAVFERETRSATVRAVGDVRALTVDRRSLLKKIQEDPTLAFRIVETMSRRVRSLTEEVALLKGKANDGTGPQSG
ncbi:MAG: cyclic nucleotide-binding domain-containing protein [Candidatus Eisenbacteria bacterium]|nr:cyclic nucleotide-binding domain-containing protein [Candidatus Eisenbacteria bacterium]